MRRVGSVWAAALAVVLGVAAPAAGQNAWPRAWVDVNLGAATPAERSFRMTGFEIVFDEVAASQAEFRLPAGASFDFGAGLMVTPRVGIGVSFTGTAHQDTAEIRVEIPHPLFFNAYGVDSGETTDALVRAEGGTHLQLMFVAHDRNNLRVRVFGGPSFLRVQQDAVDAIFYDQVFGIFTTLNQVTILSYDPRTAEASGWGFHLGGDVSYFLTRVVGLGGFVRLSRATVELPNLLGSGRVPVTAGGVQAGGGLRLRW